MRIDIIKKAFLLFIFCVVFTNAKNLPVEKSLVTGKLENGLSYSIKKNKKPENKASLRLLVNAGSLEEDEDQKGIAHLVEHMAFNGTKNFAGNDLIKFLESIGVAFGSHLNASTGSTRTLYQLSVPLKKDNLEKAMLIFKDWAGEINFTQEELDKERGVILEEARSRNNVRFRMFLQSKEVLYANTKYKDRTPIGDMNIIKNISLERVKAFYDDWYRPELMHFAIVGDFDTKKVEKLIKETFSGLKNKSKRKPESRAVPLVEKTRFMIAKDKELTSFGAGISFYKNSYHTLTQKDYKKDLIFSIMTKLFNAKGSEQTLKRNPAAKSISTRLGFLGDNLLSLNFMASFTGFNELKAFKELTSLIYSIEKYGFDKKDFNMIVKKLKIENKEKLKSLDNKTSDSYVNQIINLVEKKELFIDENVKIELEDKLLSEITLDEVNSLYRELLSSKSRIIAYQLSDEHQISEEKVKKILANAKKNVKKQEKTIDLPNRIINTKDLSPIKIIDEKYNKKYDFYEFYLENGIKIAYKFNDYTKNSVSLNAFSKGGFSLYDTKDLTNARFALRIIPNSGYDKFNVIDYRKIYADKTVKFRPFIGRYSEAIKASSSTKDFEYLLETLYLFANKYRFDENIFENMKHVALANLKKEDNVPSKKFLKEFMSYKYKGNKRYTTLTKEELKTLNKEKILNIYKDRFSDFNNFTFVIVGDISKNEVKKQIIKYFGNLPTKKREESFYFRGIKPVKGEHKFVRYFNNENITDVSLNYTKEMPYSKEEAIKLSALRDVLNVKLREFIREEKSGVYGVSVRASFPREPYEETAISISFSCDPARKDELIKYVKQTIQDLKTNLVSQKYINSFVKKRLINLEEVKKKPRFWSSKLKSYYYYNDSLDNIEKYGEILKSITPKTVLDTANKYLNTKNIIHTELNPKNIKK